MQLKLSYKMIRIAYLLDNKYKQYILNTKIF